MIYSKKAKVLHGIHYLVPSPKILGYIQLGYHINTKTWRTSNHGEKQDLNQDLHFSAGDTFTSREVVVEIPSGYTEELLTCAPVVRYVQVKYKTKGVQESRSHAWNMQNKLNTWWYGEYDIIDWRTWNWSYYHVNLRIRSIKYYIGSI